MNNGVVEFALTRLRHHLLPSFAVSSFWNLRRGCAPAPALASSAVPAFAPSWLHSSALAFAPYPCPCPCPWPPHIYTPLPSLYLLNLLSPHWRSSSSSSSSSDSSVGQESVALLASEARVDRAAVCSVDTDSRIGELAACPEEAPPPPSSPSSSLSSSSPSLSSSYPFTSPSLFSSSPSPSLSLSSSSSSSSSLSPSPSSLSPSSLSSSSPSLSSSSSSPPLPNPHHPSPSSSLSPSSSSSPPPSSSSDGFRRTPARARPMAESKRRGEVLGRMSDLLRVPGIGPRNLEKLAAKGIEKLAELKQLYLDKFNGDTSGKMVEYLRDSVGIIHKNHAESIAAFVKGIADEDSKVDGSPDTEHPAEKKNRLTFCIEGNISVGKTTFLERITNEAIELRDLVEIVPEPVEKWQNIGPEHFNILNAFYEEPTRYAYTFQNYVFITRLMQEQETREGLKPLRLMERSVFSDRMVFVRAVHEAKMMNEMEISIYDSWFDPVVSTLPGLVPDGFIYLRASPDTCLRRLQTRQRPEEHSVTLDYLRGLHEKHEQWLFPAEGHQEVVSISRCSSEIQELLPSKLRGRVFYLEGDHIHSRIRKVPTLVLDCEASIDFARDIEAKSEYAQQVAEFFEFVKHKKGEKKDDNALSSGLVLPQASGLLGPDGSVLCSQAFNPLRFKENSSAFTR